nr:hypothetical protein [Tanacetum cinerariifolium]
DEKEHKEHLRQILELLKKKELAMVAGFLWERVGKVMGSSRNGGEVERSEEEGWVMLARNWGCVQQWLLGFVRESGESDGKYWEWWRSGEKWGRRLGEVGGKLGMCTVGLNVGGRQG